MAKQSNQLEQHDLDNGTFGYSATSLEDLGATEYTIVTIVNDTSGSVTPFKKAMEDALAQIIESCKYSKRADNLMIRVLHFDDNLKEFHGFKLLADCDLKSYDNSIVIGGSTALFDASHNAISATSDYAKKLVDSDFSVNSIVFIITDGDDNMSTTATPKKIKKLLQDIMKEEKLESMVTVLIGVGTKGNPTISQYLANFKNEAGLTQFIELENANAKSLARLADFVSKSISAQSNALGTGGPSQQLDF